MKIYINTAHQPPTLSASASTQTDASGVLRVYSSSLGSSVSALAFKRGTTVPLEVIFPSDAAAVGDIAKLRYGLKLKGRYDDALVLLCESTEPQAQEDGTIKFTVKPTFEAGVIDQALAVNSDSADDVESAAFISEFEWENADGEIAASATAATTIQNNVIRRGAGGASATSIAANWTSLLVIRMSWADYCALEEPNPDALYLIPDAPREIDEHDANPAAHQAMRELIAADIETAVETARQLVNEKAEELASDLSELAAAQVSAATENLSTQIELAQAAATAAQEAATSVTANVDNKVAAEATARAAADTALSARLDALEVSAASPTQFCADARTTLNGETNTGALCAGWYGYMANLIPSAEQPTDTAGIVPMRLALHRYTSNTTNATVPVYARILRRDESGTAWTVAYQSRNAVRMDSVATDGAAVGPWLLENTDGRGAIPHNENIILCFCNAADAAATTYSNMSARTTAAIRGAFTAAISADGTAPGTYGYSWQISLTWGTAENTITLAELIAAVRGTV